MKQIEMTVEGIGIDPHNNPLVLLRDSERKTFVPIWIGPAEAVSIQMELDGRHPPRPMTHDLISNIFNEFGIQVLKVTINDFADSVYFSSLHLQIGASPDAHDVDARPSDAIALALRAQCPILVAETVAQKAGIQIEETDSDDETTGAESKGDASSDEIEKLSRLLEGVDLSGEGGKN
jgi:bifunctional DNase/RNase